MPDETKQCLQCGHRLMGRNDKKFCDDLCRTAYNNRLKAMDGCERQINRILHRNRTILQQLIPSDHVLTEVTVHRLAQQGFNFAFHTHRITDEAGREYTCCYDYGYQQINPAACVVIRHRT